jgi:diguanylate cyclase (GGDEF)-like protein
MFGSLRVKLAVATLVLVALGAFGAAWYVRDRLARPYEQSLRAQLEGVGRTLALDLDEAQLRNPRRLKPRLERLRRADPDLISVSVYRREGASRALVATARAPGASTATMAQRRQARRTALSGYGLSPLDRERRGAPLRNRAPRAAQLSVPVRGELGGPIGDVVVRLDRSPTDTALARDVGQLIVLATILALIVGLGFAALLSRAVLNPLQQLREAIHALRAGAGETRLAWDRSDELGELSGDFDAMAAQLQESHSRLQSLALKDPLTGLLNHRSFHETLQRELAEADQANATVALVVLDLDHFKEINDTYGHPYGDEVLRTASRSLRGAVRQGDLVARVGGEEFALILPGADAELGHSVAERARAGLTDIDVQSGRLTCSAGVAAFPAHASDAAGLFAVADGALYWAKDAGRDQTRVFDPEHVTAVAPDEQRAEIEAILANPDMLRPVYQPWVELATGRLAGYEALTRFDGPADRAPDEWFARAHRCGLGERLEALAIQRALATPGRPEGTFLSINLSPSVLTSPVLDEALPESLSLVVIEVTEQEAIVDLPGVERVLDGFRRRGARIALDDAGVGYAGLQELMRLRPDIIKLDRSLICDLPNDPAKVALAESLVRFAQRTGAAVCGEGIEGLDELVVLADLDMTYGQGYALARPGPAWPQADEAMLDVLRRRSARSDLDPMDDIGSTEAGDRRLEHICARISACTTLEDLASVLAIVAVELDAQDVCVSRWERARRQVITFAVSPGCPDPGGGSYDLVDYPTTERVLVHGDAAQLLAGDHGEVETHFLGESGHGSLLMVPVAFAGETIGLLEVMRRRERAFTRSQTNRARIIAHQLGGTLGAGRIAPATAVPTMRYRGSERLAEA